MTIAPERPVTTDRLARIHADLAEIEKLLEHPNPWTGTLMDERSVLLKQQAELLAEGAALAVNVLAA